MWCTGLVAPRHVRSSWTRDRTCVPCIGRRILNHCATREVLCGCYFKTLSLGFSLSMEVCFQFSSIFKHPSFFQYTINGDRLQSLGIVLLVFFCPNLNFIDFLLILSLSLLAFVSPGMRTNSPSVSSFLI